MPSLKLVNYAQDNLGKLKLFTELSHNFNIDDKLYINGGFYDNTSGLLNITDYNNVFPDIYNPYISGYKVIEVDYNNNSLTIDYVTTTGTLIYPYGDVNNRFGDHTDSINVSYNSEDRGVFISKSIILAGSMYSCTINNGIVGNDNNEVVLNLSNTQNNCQINNFISKNTKIITGNIDGNVDLFTPTNICVISEDISVNPNNPHTYQIIPNTLQNYGYSKIEKIENIGVVDIKNCRLENTKLNNILLNNLVSIDNVLIGRKEFSNINIQSNITNSLIYGLDFNAINFTNCDFNSGINLYATTVTFGNDGQLILNIRYDAIVNKNFPVGSQILLTGLNDGTETEIMFYSYITGTITNINYTFGVQNSASIEFTINYTDWSNYSSLILNGNNCKLFFINENIISKFTQSTISAYFNNNSSNNLLLDNCVLNNGMYNNLTVISNTDIIGDNYYNSIICYNFKQLNNDIKNDIEYTYINNTTLNNIILLCNRFNHSKTENISIVDTIEIDYSIIDSSNLYNCNIKNSIITNSLFDKCNLVNNGIDNNFNINAQLNDRLTPFVTHIANDYTYNLNTIQSISYQSVNFYDSQRIVTTDNTNIVPKYLMDFEVPSHYGMNINNDFFIIEENVMISTFSAILWFSLYRTNKFYYNRISDDITPTITDKTNANTSGNYTIFNTVLAPYDVIPTHPSALLTTTVFKVDDNYVTQLDMPYITNNTDFKTNRTFTDIKTIKFDRLPTPNDLPDPVNSDMNQAFQLFRKTNHLPNVQLTNGGNSTYTASIPDFKLIFKIDNNFIKNNANTNATVYPVPFIEIEYIKVTKTDTNTNVQTKELYITNHVTDTSDGSADKYDVTNTVNANSHEASYDSIIQYNNNDLVITSPVDNIIDIEVIYWTQYYYTTFSDDSQNGTVPGVNIVQNLIGGYREKNTFTHQLINVPQSQLIINTTDYLVDNNNNNIATN